MKDKITAVHVNFGDYKNDIGDLYIHRLNHIDGENKMKSYQITPRRVARVLEAQRLFLAQLEKKAGKV